MDGPKKLFEGCNQLMIRRPMAGGRLCFAPNRLPGFSHLTHIDQRWSIVLLLTRRRRDVACHSPGKQFRVEAEANREEGFLPDGRYKSY